MKSTAPARQTPARITLVVCALLIAGDLPAGDVLPRAPREMQRGLAAARSAIEQRRFSDATVLLDALLSREGDEFVPATEKDGPQRTLRSECEALLLLMPDARLRDYQAWRGENARRMLEDAVRRRDYQSLARVALRFPVAPAGQEAALLLGYDGLDRARPFDALAWFGRVARVPAVARELEPELTLTTAVGWLMADRPDRARNVLGRLRSINGEVEFRIDGRPFRAADEPDKILAALADALGPDLIARETSRKGWPMFRGDATRTAGAKWSGSVDPLLWRVEVPEAETAQKPPSRPRGTRLPSATLPGGAAHPLISDRLVLARTPSRLVAVDVSSGRQIWEFPWGGERDVASQNGAALRFGVKGNLATQRGQQDAAYGQLSRDDRRVYLLDGLGAAWLGGASMVVRMVGLQGANVSGSPPPHNRLVALSPEQEGKLVWSVGGLSGEEEPRLAGAFFLGPPLPRQGRLYALAEMNEEIVLCELDAATGRLEWSLPLATPERAILQDSRRRLAGASPSLLEGVIVCPTSAGAVVAVELGTRSILWGYQYPTSSTSARGARPVRRGAAVKPGGSIDSSVTIAAGHALLAPVESNQWFCLNLRTGQLAWRRSSEELLYLGGVHDETVVAVGAGGLSAWDLKTGKPAWPTLGVEIPDEGRVSGRGILVDHFYCVPTSESEILRFDVTDGSLVGRMSMKTKPGNLVACGPLLISQSPKAVEAFGEAPPRP